MSNTSQPAHSKIGASSYYRWKACPGSVKLSENIPSQESSYALQGTIAHDIAAQMLEDYFFRKGKPNIPPGYDSEDLDAVKTYVQLIKKDALANGCNASQGHVLIEHRFDLSSVHPGLFGTSDATLYAPETKKLKVYDYKHGAGIAVDVEDNLQLQYYGLGALLSSGFPCTEVELIIVQPRCNHPDGPVRRWSFQSIDLIEFAAQLSDDAKKTEEKDAELNPGDHCRFCPAAATACPALRKKAKALAKSEFSPVQDYDEKKLTEALDFIPALEAWIKNVREFAYSQAQCGKTPPGYKLVAKRATRKWVEKDETKLAEALECLLPDQSFYKKSILSPTQVEKLLPKDLRKELTDLVSKESSGHTLVHESDKRQAVKLDATEDFKPTEKLN